MIKINNSKSDISTITYYTDNNSATALRMNNKIVIDYSKPNISTYSANFSNISKVLNVSISLLFILFIVSVIKDFLLIVRNFIPVIDTRLLYIFPAIIIVMVCIKDIHTAIVTNCKEGTKNYGAENMVYNAYLNLKRVPNIEETKKFSRISLTKYKSENIISTYLILQSIGYTIFLNTGYIIPETILFFGILILRNIFPFTILSSYAQLFYTSKPKDNNIELAIAAITALEEIEKTK